VAPRSERVQSEATSRAPAARPGALLLANARAVSIRRSAAVFLVASLVVGVHVFPGCAPLVPGGEPPDEQAPGMPSYQRPEPDPELQRAWAEVVEAAPLVRVGLERDVDNVSISADGPYRLTVYSESVETFDAGGGDVWHLSVGGAGLRGRAARESFNVRAGTVRAAPVDGSFLSVNETAYRGEVEVFLDSSGGLSVVNIIDLESYLRGVVPLEIGPRPMAELEAVKAQAVAARTYALASGGKRAGGDYDMHATVADQVYGGVPAEHETSDRAVLETAGLAVTWGGEPVVAYFHANCGGRSEARHEVWEMEEVPYLASTWDTPGGIRNLEKAYCSEGSGFTWRVEWSGRELDRLVADRLHSTASTPVEETPGRLRNLRVTERTPSGRVKWLEVETDAGTWRIYGDRCRWLLRRDGDRILRSSWYDLDVERRGGHVTRVVANGRGYGHGVGMCQHGALERARQGYSYIDILSAYYRGTSVRRVY